LTNIILVFNFYFSSVSYPPVCIILLKAKLVVSSLVSVIIRRRFHLPRWKRASRTPDTSDYQRPMSLSLARDVLTIVLPFLMSKRKPHPRINNKYTGDILGGYCALFRRRMFKRTWLMDYRAVVKKKNNRALFYKKKKSHNVSESKRRSPRCFRNNRTIIFNGKIIRYNRILSFTIFISDGSNCSNL